MENLPYLCIEKLIKWLRGRIGVLRGFLVSRMSKLLKVAMLYGYALYG
jgi:hypothetical protein